MHPVKEYLDDEGVEYKDFYGTGFDDSVTIEEMKNGEKEKFSDFLTSEELDEWINESKSRTYQEMCHIVFNRKTLTNFISVMETNDEYQIGYVYINDDRNLMVRITKSDTFTHYNGGYDMENNYGKIYFDTKSVNSMLPHFVFYLYDVNRVEFDGEQFIVETEMMDTYPEKHD